MGRGQVISSPDGDRWRVRRRWMDRDAPNLRKRFGRGRKESDGWFDLPLPDLFDSAAGLAILAATVIVLLLLFFVLLPLIGLLLELLVLFVVLSSGLFGKLLLGRPWTVEARNLDDPERSVAYAIKGYRRAGDAVTELASAIGAVGPPERLTAGERTLLPRPEA
jgi:hypothetical protein